MLSSIFLIFAAIAYMALRLFFNERLAQIHVYSDEENLTHLTQARGVSAYQLFYIAGNAWNQTESKIETDFKDYLKTSNQPHYVRDFIRKNITASDHHANADLNPFGKMPPVWLA